MNQVVSRTCLGSLHQAHSTLASERRSISEEYIRPRIDKFSSIICRQNSQERTWNILNGIGINSERSIRADSQMVNRDSGLLATLTAGVLFGLAIPMIKFGLDRNIPPLSFAALRFELASLFVLMLLRNRGWVVRSLILSRQVWLVGLLNAVWYLLQFEGQLFTTGSEAALIIGTAALMIPLMSWLKRQEPFRATKALGVVVGFAGVALLVLGQPSQASIENGQHHLFGDALLAATAVTIALVFIFTKSLAVKHGDRGVTGGM